MAETKSLRQRILANGLLRDGAQGEWDFLYLLESVKGLTPIDCSNIRYLFTRLGSNDCWWCSRRVMSEEMGWSARGIITSTKRLDRHGLIVVIEYYENGYQKENRYSLNKNIARILWEPQYRANPPLDLQRHLYATVTNKDAGEVKGLTDRILMCSKIRDYFNRYKEPSETETLLEELNIPPKNPLNGTTSRDERDDTQKIKQNNETLLTFGNNF